MKCDMAALESNIPSSMFMSNTTAPFSTWVFATFSAFYTARDSTENQTDAIVTKHAVGIQVR